MGRFRGRPFLEMRKFPRQSILSNDSFVKYDFAPGLGYHVSSPVARALSAGLWTMTTSPANDDASVFPPNATATVDDDDEKGDVTRVDHSVSNVDRADVYDLDQFMSSVDLALDPVCYRAIVATAKGGRSGARTADAFQRLPFQQFMTLDSILAMVDRSGLSEYRILVSMRVAEKMGYGWMTWSKADQLQRLFSRRVVALSVRRRMGKSVAVYAELARCLAFFPAAGIKALYTVHVPQAATDCHGAVSSAVGRLVEERFNPVQKRNFQSRINGRGGFIDGDDFYYRAKANVSFARASIVVDFFRMNRHGDCNGGNPVSSNTLVCRAHTKTHVSI